ncbi:2-oxoglutarate-dependent dioxygenase [Pyrus ussuriensis x Pyrus communis]|uniref:2-oxoglutarate-dependent dioxygenase n=1 Tax=Pyrus ussuriensis x Pyrus communis TaxID=2448454 RepID=A0A5N5H5Q1_9ROSA|nr:2-oxoglutarate-dependent dioxygenase [Pyrus ussuriensis x Pyrus communis]
MLGEAIETLGLLHYDDQVSDPANEIFGAGAHSDSGFITLLATDDVVGLLGWQQPGLVNWLACVENHMDVFSIYAGWRRF